MTAQINDMFRYRGVEYSVAGISEGELFDPAMLDLKPAAASTACWRGYQAVFALSDARLVLDVLRVNLSDDRETPLINGVKPTSPTESSDFLGRLFSHDYYGLNYHLDYTGGLLLADGIIRDLYVHMGFHPAWKYETVIELIFDSGSLAREFDRSQAMADTRAAILASRDDRKPTPMPTEDEIRELVDRAFDRSYEM